MSIAHLFDAFEKGKIKEEIKLIYSKYIEETSKREIFLMEIAEYFRIPIDESRPNDYEIVSIDYSLNISIKILDKKEKTKYVSNYVYGNNDLLNLINVKVISEYKELNILYYRDFTLPVKNSLMLKNGDYNLLIRRERPNDTGMFYLQENDELSIVFSRVNNKSNEMEYLLDRKYAKHNGEQSYEFEHYYTFPDEVNKVSISQQNYFYSIDDNIVYGINYYFDKGNILGAFFENVKFDGAKRCFPDNLYSFTDSEFEDVKTVSAIIILGNYDGDFSKIRVYKTTNNIIGYYEKKVFSANYSIIKIIGPVSFKIKNLNEGMITGNEVKYILEYLRSNFVDNNLNLISDDFEKFANRIDNKKKWMDNDLLSLREFFDKPFEEISAMFEKNKEKYFELFSQQYLQISDNLSKRKERVLKLNDINA